MPWSETLPHFSFAGTVLTVLLLLFAAVGEPLLGRKAFTWLSGRRGGDVRALTQVHAVTIAVHVLWGLVVLLVLLLSPDLLPSDLGLRLPDAWGPVVGGAVGGLVALAAMWVLVNGLPVNLPGTGGRASRKGGGRRAASGRRGRGSGRPDTGGSREGAAPGDPEGPEDAERSEPGAVAGRRAGGHRGRRAAAAPMTLPEPERGRGLLVPRTTAERAMAGGVAVTGGVFGELLYRGLFIALVAGLGAPLWMAAALSVALFSVAHLYQGWWGLVSAGTSGTLFTVLYLGTGSIWVPVAVHVALDLRSLVFPPPAVREEGERLHEDYGDDYEDDYEDGYEDAGYEDGYDEYGDGPAPADTGAMPPVGDGHPAPSEQHHRTAPPASGGTPPDGARAFGEPPARGHRADGSAQGGPGRGGPPPPGAAGGAGGTVVNGGPYGGAPAGWEDPAVGGTPAHGAPSWGGSDRGNPVSGGTPSHGVSAPEGAGWGAPEQGGSGRGAAGWEDPAVGGTPAHGAPSWGGPDLGGPVQGGPAPTGGAVHGAPSWGGPGRHDTGRSGPVPGETPGHGAPSWGEAPGHGGHGPSAADPYRRDPGPHGGPGGAHGRAPEAPEHGGRHLYPDEWIDHRYGDGGHDQGPDAGPRT
ncbi:type II CAAX prenyl endopeptidase Rce1 family protein [Nocardiopsis tropica]|uniref:CPBP family glutamic-type intramembrane protease n=1 Tax=Nocardiopsis tropica TaxID=109330 RepID=A0ABU7KZ54_9ACTN|nr:CPBP family glutamic-type intramembrane protease [Nocardiopsis umidischolae]MEE2054573.1 CPBP family glutamic-type intramembrane protease [Nocardiopsis umidischolae]